MENRKKPCFRQPIPEIFHAAFLLDAAVSAMELNDSAQALDLITSANSPEIRDWTESLWGVKSKFVVVNRAIAEQPPYVKYQMRMPNRETKEALLRRDGYHCRFCHIPLIRADVRSHLAKLLPTAAIWGNRNSVQHAAFQCMWVQYDHILPHARGGDNSLQNMVITCAPCNYSRMNWTLEEVGLANPFHRPPFRSSWHGLERAMQLKPAMAAGVIA